MYSSISLNNLSPLDSRYLNETKELRKYFSESAFIKYRIRIEVLYLIELVEYLGVVKLPNNEKAKLVNWVNNLTNKDVLKVKITESKIKHDVKAIEYFIRSTINNQDLTNLSPWVHWGLTSEDVNNLAYALMIKDALKEVVIPNNKKLLNTLLILSEKHKNLVMPARTHGQLAVPTTFGKELIVFTSRASYFLEKVMELKLCGKLNGAAGNYNAHSLIYPEKDWLKFSNKFIKKLGLEPNEITTQIEPGVTLVYLFDLLRQLNNVWLDLCKDMWLYISYDYLIQQVAKNEVGSSTMPHKVNPINFENAEGNFELSNSILTLLSNKLPQSRLQRDLSDSTVKRNFGTTFGYQLIAMKSLSKGLDKIRPNRALLKRELENHPEMLTEGLQLYLKTKGDKKAYEQIKLKTRGKKANWKEVIKYLKPDIKKDLYKWNVSNYYGLAPNLVEKEIRRIKKLFTIK